MAPEDVSEDALAARLFAPELPDPDLVIRTSGEQRLSNFLLWQSAYAELVFADTLWPDFGAEPLRAALDEYAQPARRFGAAEQGDSRDRHRIFTLLGAPGGQIDELRVADTRR